MDTYVEHAIEDIKEACRMAGKPDPVVLREATFSPTKFLTKLEFEVDGHRYYAHVFKGDVDDYGDDDYLIGHMYDFEAHKCTNFMDALNHPNEAMGMFLQMLIGQVWFEQELPPELNPLTHLAEEEYVPGSDD